MMTTTLTSDANSVLLEDISWQTYESLLKDFEESPGMRLTFDRGRLEIMTPLPPHESHKKLIGRLVETVTEEINI